MTFTEFLRNLLPTEIASLVVAQVFFVVFMTLLLDMVQKRFVRHLERVAATNRMIWDDALLYALRRPLTFIIWLLGISFATEIIGRETDATIFEAVTPVRNVGVIVVLAWFLIRLVRGMETQLVARRRARAEEFDATTVDAISKLARSSVIITATLVVLQTLGFSVSGVLAFGGIGGIAVGFAAKDLLANFFGGLMIYLDRPFAVGEWIRSPDREIEGTVEEIGWRLTRIRTFDKRPLYIPNSIFANIALENPSRMSHRRIYETIGVRYEDAAKLPEIVSAVREMLYAHPEIDPTQTLIVNFNSFAPSSLDFFIYTFTRTTQWVRYHEVKQAVLLSVLEIITAHGAEVAFPTTTVHLATAEGEPSLPQEPTPWPPERR